MTGRAVEAPREPEGPEALGEPEPVGALGAADVSRTRPVLSRAADGAVLGNGAEGAGGALVTGGATGAAGSWTCGTGTRWPEETSRWGPRGAWTGWHW